MWLSATRSKGSCWLLDFEKEGRLGEQGSDAEAWLLPSAQGGLWGTATTRGTEGRDPAAGQDRGEQGSPSTRGAGGAFVAGSQPVRGPTQPLSPPAAPSVTATATTRTVSHMGPCTVLAGHMPSRQLLSWQAEPSSMRTRCSPCACTPGTSAPISAAVQGSGWPGMGEAGSLGCSG